MSVASASQVAAVRRFNRFYTRQIGLLQGRWLDSPFSLTEARVLYELAQRPTATASDIVRALGIDPGYLSRMLARFLGHGLIAKARAPDDARRTLLRLTAKGRKAFAPLERRSQDQVAAMLAAVPAGERGSVVRAMTAIETALNKPPADTRHVVLRPHRPGDMGWVVARHGALYAAEYGWNAHIEAITADIVSAFLKNFDAAREQCWIAEVDGEPAGCVFLVRDTDDTARIRLLLVEPEARGLGIGRRLVEECIGFARKVGYRRITLWTHTVLEAARAIYQRAGFVMTRQWVHNDFGKDESSETWDLTL